MIGYAPFDPGDQIEIVPTPGKREVVSNEFVNSGNNRKNIRSRVVQDDTECNHLVMFFIIGVIALAAMDMVKR